MGRAYLHTTESGIPILVISCDRYADLWGPFFTLFWKRWPDCQYPVYLGTNYRTYPDPRVTSITIGEDISWSANVVRMVEHLNADYVLLFLEDFLIQRTVNTGAVDRLVRIARERQLGCLRLAAKLPLAFPPSHPSDDFPDLGVIAPGEPSRVSVQVAIWQINTLRRLLVPGLSAWEFETVGTQMSKYMSELFWATYEPAIVYTQAVEKGKWKPEGLAVCGEAGVEVDLDAREVFGEAELRRHYLDAGVRYQSYEAKRSAIRHFRVGERVQGVRRLLQFMRQHPVSVQAWAVLALGVLGPRCIAWLERQYVRLKVARARLG